MAGSDAKPKKTMPKYMRFVNGGLAGVMTICCVQPLDLMKNRLQISGREGRKKEYSGVVDVIVKTYKNEGIVGFYNGLSAGVIRQATYTTTRLGVYSTLFDMFSKEGQNPGFLAKATFGLAAGMIGSFIGTPADVALIRMSLDGRLPASERRNYHNVFHAWIKMTRDEGITTLWRGAAPTVIRAMVINAAQLATYSQSKEKILAVGISDGIFLHLCASLISGLAAVVSSLPIDVIKTRIQNMKMINGKGEYEGALDASFKLFKLEGPLAFWKGFVPYYFRIAPYTILMFLFLENLNQLYSKYILKIEKSGGM